MDAVTDKESLAARLASLGPDDSWQPVHDRTGGHTLRVAFLGTS